MGLWRVLPLLNSRPCPPRQELLKSPTSWHGARPRKKSGLIPATRTRHVPQASHKQSTGWGGGLFLGISSRYAASGGFSRHTHVEIRRKRKKNPFVITRVAKHSSHRIGDWWRDLDESKNGHLLVKIDSRVTIVTSWRKGSFTKVVVFVRTIVKN